MTLEELFTWAYSLPEELIITIERPCQVNLTPGRNIYTMKNYEYWCACISVPYPDVTVVNGEPEYGHYLDPGMGCALVWSDGPDMHEVMQHLYDQYKDIEASWREDEPHAHALHLIADYRAKHHANA